MTQPKSQLSPTYLTQNKKNKKQEQQKNNSELCLTERKLSQKFAIFHPCLSFTPGVVQTHRPVCDLKGVKYKAKIEFNQRVSSALIVFPNKTMVSSMVLFDSNFSVNKIPCRLECKVRYPFHLLLSIKDNCDFLYL